MGNRPEDVWRYVDVCAENECWPWTAFVTQSTPLHPGGYGHFSIGGKPRRAHIIVLELKLGRPLMLGMKACHTCDNPPCCNPVHLYEGTHRDNMDDVVRRGRAGQRGERSRTNVLTVEQVRAIRADPGRHVDVAVKYGVSAVHIHRIRKRKVWAWLDAE